jgi:hypothetical protein
MGKHYFIVLYTFSIYKYVPISHVTINNIPLNVIRYVNYGILNKMGLISLL